MQSAQCLEAYDSPGRTSRQAGTTHGVSSTSMRYHECSCTSRQVRARREGFPPLRMVVDPKLGHVEFSGCRPASTATCPMGDLLRSTSSTKLSVTSVEHLSSTIWCATDV